MASKVLARNMATAVARNQQVKKAATSRTLATSAIRAGSKPTWALAGAAAAGTVMAITVANNKTFCDARRSSGMPVIMAGTAVEEPDTGIMFPPMVNGFTFMGCGVRIKYVFVKVYAVGAYLHPEDFAGMKDDAAIEKALLDPFKHKVIRIVMNRSMTMDKYNDAIVEALTPRMNGQDMDKLDEFKKLNPSGNLEKDTELLMTIRGDTLLYKNALGNVGTIQSEVFTKAMCDVYFGDSPVSPPAKAKTIEAVKKL